MPIPAPPIPGQQADASAAPPSGGDPLASTENIPQNTREKIFGTLGGVLSKGLGPTMYDMIQQQHTQRLHEAQMHQKNAATIASHLTTAPNDPVTGQPMYITNPDGTRTPVGLNPDTGLPMSPADREKFTNQYNAAEAAYKKAAGVDKNTKELADQHTGLMRLGIQHGHEVIHKLFGAHQQAQQAAAAAGAPAPAPSATGLPNAGAPGPNDDQNFTPSGGLPGPPTANPQPASEATAAPQASPSPSAAASAPASRPDTAAPDTAAPGSTTPTPGRAVANLPKRPSASYNPEMEGYLMPNRAASLAARQAGQQAVLKNPVEGPAGVAQRHATAKLIGLVPGTREYSQYVATGTFPLLHGMQLKPFITPDGKITMGEYSPYGGGVTGIDGGSLPDGTRIATSAEVSDSSIYKPISYKGPDGEHLEGWRRNGELFDQQKKPLPPDTEAFDASLAPTSTVNTTIKTMPDAQGNLVQFPVTSTSTRTRGGLAAPPQAGGTSAGTPTPVPTPTKSAGAGTARPIAQQGGGQLHRPLSAPAKNTLFQIDSASGLIDAIKPDIQAVVEDMKRGGNLWDSAQVRSAWEQYTKLGIDPSNVDPSSVVAALPNVDPRIARLFPTIAMLQIVGAQPYLRGMRRFEYVQQVQQHLPDPTKDTPQLMLAKLEQLSKTGLPNLKNAVYESEGIKGSAPAAAAATPDAKSAPPKPRPTNAADYLKSIGR